MFQQVLSPQGTWSNTVQYQYINVAGAAAIGVGYVAVPMVIYNGACYYAKVPLPTVGTNPASNPSQWVAISDGGSGTVSGPGTSTPTAVALWGNSSGTLLTNSTFLIDGSSNGSGLANLSISGIFSSTASNSGGAQVIQVQNSSNTSNSSAILKAITGGSSAGDAYSFYQAGSANYYAGLNTSTGNYKISIGGFGVTDVMSLSNVGAVSFGSTITAQTGNIVALTGAISAATNITGGGNLSLTAVGSKIFIKTGVNATLSSAQLGGGQVVVANTSVTANSEIFVTRTATNGSTALGLLSVTAKNNGVSFTVQALDPSNPSSVVGADNSGFYYWIVDTQ